MNQYTIKTPNGSVTIYADGFDYLGDGSVQFYTNQSGVKSAVETIPVGQWLSVRGN